MKPLDDDQVAFLKEQEQKQEQLRRVYFYYYNATIRRGRHPDIRFLVWLGKITSYFGFTKQVNPAPGSWLYRFFRFVCSRKTFTHVYEPVFSDMWSEYYEALKSGGEWKARWIIVRTIMQLVNTIWVFLWFSLIDKIIKMWKVGG